MVMHNCIEFPSCHYASSYDFEPYRQQRFVHERGAPHDEHAHRRVNQYEADALPSDSASYQCTQHNTV